MGNAFTVSRSAVQARPPAVARGRSRCRADMDDVERAILYSFDESGAVSPDLKVGCRSSLLLDTH